MPTKRNNKNKLDPAPDSLGDPDPEIGLGRQGLDDLEVILGAEQEIEEPEPFGSEWWNDPEGRPVSVQVIRMEPATWIDPDTGREYTNLRGYCGEIPKHLKEIGQSPENYILQNWGGHLYLVQKRVGGQIRKQRTVRIADLPPRLVTSCSSARSRPGGPVNPYQPPTGIGDDEMVEGVRISGDERTFQARLDRHNYIEATKTANQTQQLLIDKLLDRALQPPAPVDLTKMIGDITSTIAAVRNAIGDGGGGGGGSNFLDLARDALASFNKIVDAKSGPGPVTGPALVPVGARRIAGEGPDQAPAQITENNSNHTAEGADKMPQMTVKDLAHAAIQTVVNAFILEHRPSPDQLIEVLDGSIVLSKTARATVKQHEDYLYSQAAIALAAHFDENEGASAEFKEYFTQVFDKYTDPEREPGGQW